MWALLSGCLADIVVIGSNDEKIDVANKRVYTFCDRLCWATLVPFMYSRGFPYVFTNLIIRIEETFWVRMRCAYFADDRAVDGIRGTFLYDAC